jgi:hypothetical protein
MILGESGGEIKEKTAPEAGAAVASRPGEFGSRRLAREKQIPLNPLY